MHEHKLIFLESVLISYNAMALICIDINIEVRPLASTSRAMCSLPVAMTAIKTVGNWQAD